MTVLYPIVLETEGNGAVSAYVPGLPVYAVAESPARQSEPSAPCSRRTSRRTRPVGQMHECA